MEQPTEQPFPRGTCPIHVFGEPEGDDRPVVLLFPDAFGPRPATFDLAERLVGEGYRVLLPDLFYAHRPYAPLSPASLFSGGEDRQRLGVFLGGLDQAAIDADVGALLAYCEREYGAAAPLGATGYCLGARYALTAATLSPRLRFAAAFHGSHLAPEQGESAHRRLKDGAARIYVGIAEHDPTFDGAEEGRLAAALRDGGVDHVIESYMGAAHGFVMPDLPVHNAAAAARHWRRLSDGLRDAFAA